MSECKKTCGNCAGLIRSVLSKDRCDMTSKPIENYSYTCKDWEPNRETEIVMQKDELKSLRQERDELKAQVAVLRGALETATDYLYNPLEPDNQCAQYKNIKNILQTTPAEDAERVQRLVSTLELASNCLVDGSAIKNEAQKALSEWRRDKCSSSAF